MKCQKGRVCVKQPGNAPEPIGRRCSGCDKLGKDKHDVSRARSTKSRLTDAEKLVDIFEMIRKRATRLERDKKDALACKPVNEIKYSEIFYRHQEAQAILATVREIVME